ncbi:hypothetical protein PFICI_12894 [Pestalotiopsis fici W106-1]|uniref:ADP-ribose 1''-phosphate phosphatase n=1 Tax=Pestalotiopsis fici (strain W106-1 / CGMCC3.15140) TaxID=1229662 RepID=W3WPY0_PESFW|nr:uncharacterized protein PFICI_12894 [Pestalotiopsis fici W106-1]ETS75950.1 hypothetical protein PFICI_12894 [Pestalotiopsis fici W106-1]
MASSKLTQSALLPHIHLLCMDSQASIAWENAVQHYKLSSSPHLQYTIHESSLSQLPADLTFDAVVSPANSYAILDGGFDDAISRAFSPRDDYAALTRHAQAHIYTTHRGYLPPGHCQLVSMPGEWREARRLRYHDGAGWGCRYLALCPTMRTPAPCGREVVYACVWSLLGALERHNDAVASGQGDAGEETGRAARIESILMTPLGTGAGRVSYEQWARQAVLAVKHWLESMENPERWMKRDWADLARIEAELKLTHGL